MTHGYVRTNQKDALVRRLRRAEGQVRGLQHCVREGGEEKAAEVTAAIERLIRSR